MNDVIKSCMEKIKFKFPYTLDDYCEHFYLENYHSHSDFSNVSTADSPTNMDMYAKRIKELGGKCLYSMEHGNQGNFYLNYDIAEREGLKIIAGTEAYWVKDRHENDRTNCHIIVHAKNNEGRKDINYLLSIANEDGYYYKPRIDLELLFQLPKDNVIITSACITGWKYPDADKIWLIIHDYFGDNFFFEVQPHNTESQKILNQKILKLAEDNDVQIICGLDSHYIIPNDTVKRDKILEYKNIKYEDEEGWYMDYPDTQTVIQRFKKQGILSDEQIILSIMNTNIFASDEIEQIVLDRNFKIPTVYPNMSYEQKCNVYKKLLNSAYKKEKFKSKDKADGIRFEAKQVMESGVVDYFLTSYAIIKDAVENEGGQLTTTGRGSSASFITNKLLGLTTIDRFNADVPMYPERFLTKERVLAGQMPDIDNNLSAQEPFIKASKKILGEHGCYPLMAIEKLKEKSAWQIYASVNGIEPQIANKISTFIDAYNKALKHADEDEKDSISITDYIPNEYVDTYLGSREYQNIIINLKCHACGFLLFNGDIRREIGLISTISETTKKRTLCANIEGGFLDEFGYVKEDYLIVDAVSLTNELFASIGESVPSADEIRSLVNNDEKTWNIYAKGITCCVNQCENKKTIPKIMKYKPKSISELSQLIAGIRPGFASLLNSFLNRENYSTGEEKIDDLLKDSAHYMLYQESIMKVLSFLGLEMGETYGVIKSISKKKLKGEKKEHLLSRLKESWLSKFGNLDNFEKVWDVISDAAAYSFNSSHSQSMALDSVYLAWFKAHHTSKFYEVAIKHYQLKNNKSKIDVLIKEAIQYFGYKLGEYKFRADNRNIHIDESHMTIIPNISSIKGIGEEVANSLYELGKNQYETFYELLKNLYSSKIDTTTVKHLIMIDYFSEYGTVSHLLKVQEYFEIFKRGDAKQISKEKIDLYKLPIDVFKKYGNETEKQFNKIDVKSILKELDELTINEELDLITKIKYEIEVLGLTRITVPSASNRYLIVQEMETRKVYTNLQLYELKSGTLHNCKIWNSTLERNPIEKGDLIYIHKLESRFKREWNGETNPKTGKRIYVPVPNEYEDWLETYSKKEKIDEE